MYVTKLPTKKCSCLNNCVSLYFLLENKLLVKKNVKENFFRVKLDILNKFSDSKKTFSVHSKICLYFSLMCQPLFYTKTSSRIMPQYSVAQEQESSTAASIGFVKPVKIMPCCGPKLSNCCFVLSIWGMIMLVCIF